MNRKYVPHASGNGGCFPRGLLPLLGAAVFTTPLYYRQFNHSFHVALLIDSGQCSGDEVLTFNYDLPDSMRTEPVPATVPVREVKDAQRIEWTIVGDILGDRGEINVRAGAYWAWCEIVVA